MIASDEDRDHQLDEREAARSSFRVGSSACGSGCGWRVGVPVARCRLGAVGPAGAGQDLARAVRSARASAGGMPK